MANPDEPDDLPSIVSSSIGLGGPVIDDTIRPTAIRHEVDEIVTGDELLQHYNYIEYEFEKDGTFCRARCYVDSIGEVAFFGPFASRDDLRPVTAKDFEDNVLKYLKRRFDQIKELDEDGYVTIWSRPG